MPNQGTSGEDALALFRASVGRDPDAIALRYFDRVMTYAEIDQESDALALWLLSRGIRAGSRIATVLQNMPQSVIMTVAVWKVAGTIVPCNPMYRPRELSRILSDAQPAVLLGLGEQRADLAQSVELAGLSDTCLLLTSSREYQSADDCRVLPQPASDDIREEESFAHVIKSYHGSRPPVETLDSASIALILYTSGTTGTPKGAMITHRNLWHNAVDARDWCGLHQDSRILCIAPFFHMTGFELHIVAAFAFGASLIMNYRFEPSLALDMIRRFRPTFTIGAITVFTALMNSPGITAADMASFERIYSGGAPIPPGLLREIQSRLNIEIYSCYGMTETTAQAHAAPYGQQIPVDSVSGALSIGMLRPGTEARIVDPDGNSVAVGQAGELLMRGGQVMAGYWNKDDAEQPFDDDGWLRSGDIAFVDANGWFYLMDRLKDMIIASGFKVWPREVEDVLYNHPAVREAAVVGVPDAYRGETVKAFIALHPGADAKSQDLIKHCRDNLAAYKVPSVVEFVSDLPKTASGKIQRAELRQA